MKKKWINFTGITLFLISSTVSILILEIGLRIAGTTFNLARESKFETKVKGYDGERDYESYEPTKKDSKTIWTIGDSFTNAGNVPSLMSYPAYLFSALENNSFNYSVVNLGQCEDPTWGAYDRLEILLQKAKKYPDIIIFLVGVSDPFYYLFSETAPPKREEQQLVTFKIDRSWYEDLRVYKVYRHIKLNFISKKISKNGRELSSQKLNSLNLLYAKIKKKLKLGSINWGEIEKEIFDLLDQHRSLLDGDINEFNFKDKIRLISNTLITPMVRGYTARLNYNKALEIYLNFIKDYPDYFWDDKRNSLQSIHAISQIMMFQSKYLGTDLITILEESTQNDLEKRESRLFKQAKKVFLKREHVENVINQKRKLVWDKINMLKQKYKFKIVIQTYPSEFKSINTFLRKIAKEKNYTIVDNFEIFKKHIKEYGRAKLFADDNHFLPLGYELMANEVFMKMMERKIIK